MSEDRLQKIIARAGFASRREAETMIAEGRVTVNGKIVRELGTKADGDRDHIKVDGKLITRAEEHRYILLYKPKEVMTTVKDPEGRKTVVDLLKGVRERVFPVGRLDYHSEGLILMTNDGELAFKVAHPTNGSVKTYHVKVRGVPEQRIIEKLERGITIDARRTRPCEISRMRTTGKTDEEGNSWFEVRLREGRTQQIRKMFKAVGHPVNKLKRVAIGPLSDPKLMAGDWRELTRLEVKMLMTQQEPKAPRVRKAPAERKPVVRTPRAAASKSTRRPATGKKSASAGTRPARKSSTKAPATRAPRKSAATKSSARPVRRTAKPEGASNKRRAAAAPAKRRR